VRFTNFNPNIPQQTVVWWENGHRVSNRWTVPEGWIGAGAGRPTLAPGYHLDSFGQAEKNAPPVPDSEGGFMVFKPVAWNSIFGARRTRADSGLASSRAAGIMAGDQGPDIAGDFKRAANAGIGSLVSSIFRRNQNAAPIREATREIQRDKMRALVRNPLVWLLAGLILYTVGFGLSRLFKD
jgi:hypothetical protein